MRRTFIAATAKIASDQDGYILELHDGALQYLSSDKDFSEVSFKTYNIALNKLTEPTGNRDDFAETTSWDIVKAALAANEWPADLQRQFFDRLTQGLRAIAMCAFVGAVALFPHARRGRNWVPFELVPIVVAYFDTSLDSFIGGPPVVQAFTGTAVVFGMGMLILGWRLHLFRRPRPRALPA